MLATHHQMTVEAELAHWLLWMIAAVAILLAVATALACADPMKGEPMSPAEARPAALADSSQLQKPFFPENPPLSEHAAAETAARLGTILEHQRAGCAADALAGWEQIQLPAETAVWREIGMAAAYMQMGDLAHAMRRLERAETMAPHHPMVAYLRGKVWMEQAEELTVVKEEDSAAQDGRPAAVRAMYERLAIADFEEAIELAGIVKLAEPLVRLRPVNGAPLPEPVVGNVMAAVQADQLEANAHRLLFQLYLARRELTEAENHLDQATIAGIAGQDDHGRLAEAMHRAGKQADAIRVLRKDLRLHHPWLDQLYRRLDGWVHGTGPTEWVW